MSPLVSPFFAAVLVLAAAGVMKAVAPASTRVALRSAGLPGTALVARTLGVAEIVVAGWALGWGGGVAAAAVCLAYLGFAGFAALLRRRTAGRASCGCFGSRDAPVTGLHVVVNLVLATAAALVAADPSGGITLAARATPWSGVPFVGLTALLAWLLIVVFTTLPELQAATARRSAPRRGAAA